ncbi:MAG TPA: hypothetical protein VFF11_02790, partial [Candidatus Binatia bacterium]|nr:hypothetical protein [Candidatus Binatia bacterium]
MGNGVTAGNLQSTYGNPYALLVNPYDMALSTGATSTGSNPTLNLNALAKYTQIDLQALDNISLNAAWTLADSGTAAALNLSAGNNINLNSSITAGNKWNVNLDAGTSYSGTAKPNSGSDGIYLNGSSYLQTKNGDITLNAANEVIVNSGAIRTIGGGNISVTAAQGDVNSGTSVSGFNYIKNAPYYTPFSVNTFLGTVGTSSSLGGISTAAGGNVTVNAGGNVTSYLPTGTGLSATGDAGTGAFGSQPGNVTINAGGSVFGHYVVANGEGNITAGRDVGNFSRNVALSLVAGSWSLNAPNGDIFLQEVRNPNGVFNTQGTSSTSQHYFNYD